MSPKSPAEPPAAAEAESPSLAERIAADIATLESEVAEIDMLAAQARTEAERHELKRSQTEAKLAALPAGSPTSDIVGMNVQLVSLTRRASVMEAQVDSLEGKRRAILRYRDGLNAIAERLGDGGAGGGDTSSDRSSSNGSHDEATPAMSRIVLNAQEDLRRDIARAMHDGPAQSLTNIVLQAQIVERIVTKDPAMAQEEVRQLIAMVQHTLDATKSFIFDVRPMVLDDLGLMPTLRRAARERSRRAGIPVEFESVGADRRLTMDIESGLFRILDEAMAGYLQASPDRVSVQLDWAARGGHPSDPAAERQGRPAGAGGDDGRSRRASRGSRAGRPERRARPVAASDLARHPAACRERRDRDGAPQRRWRAADRPRPGVRRTVLIVVARLAGQRGQGIVEYGLILALSTVVAVVVLVFFGGTLSAVLEVIGQAIDQAS